MKPMNFRKLNSAVIPKSSPSVRAARGKALQLFDLRRRKDEVDRRVEAARDRLESVDVFGLRRELEDALREQAHVEAKLAELQGDNVLMAG
jgi:hypothetical protein